MGRIDVFGVPAEPMVPRFDNKDDDRYPSFGLELNGSKSVPAAYVIGLLRGEERAALLKLLERWGCLSLVTDQHELLQRDEVTNFGLRSKRLDLDDEKFPTKHLHADISPQLLPGQPLVAERGYIVALPGVTRKDPTIVTGRKRLAELLLENREALSAGNPGTNSLFSRLAEKKGQYYENITTPGNGAEWIMRICERVKCEPPQEGVGRVLQSIVEGMRTAHIRFDWGKNMELTRFLFFDNKRAMHKRGELTDELLTKQEV